LKVDKTKKVLLKLEKCIDQNKPFSLIRFGDGLVKIIHALTYHDNEQLVLCLKKEGIPKNKVVEYLEIIGRYARQADYIDFIEIYFTNNFWSKCGKNFSQVKLFTIERMKQWKQLYSRFNIQNDNFCNPEISYLSCLKLENQKNIYDILKGKKVCFISTFKKMGVILPFKYDSVQIVGHYQNHYENSYYNTLDFIHKNANKYDCFLVCAGELGRIYSGVIKENGGRSFDFGSVVNYYNEKEIRSRITTFIKPSSKNDYEFELTIHGIKYKKFL
jgi:hypothetical protein